MGIGINKWDQNTKEWNQGTKQCDIILKKLQNY